MLKRISVVSALATVVIASVAMTGVATARPSKHRHRPGHGPVVPGAPDQVIQWNQELQKVLVAPGAQPTTIHPTRTMAIAQIAEFDAVNGIEREFRPLLVDARGPRDASPSAAIAAAADTTLDALLPTQQATIDAYFQSSLAQIGSGGRVQEGIEFGQRVANAVLAARAEDGASGTPPVFTPLTGPGEYQLTPPTFTPAAFTQTAHVKPFVLRSPSQFRPPAPPALTSARYAQDFSEVHSLGELGSTTRTPDQTAVGRFWGAAPVWVVWNQVADQAGLAFGSSLERNARMFAILDVTLAESAITLYDAKYTYHRWRPITAITAADQGNPNTTSDPAWVPLANTANDPSYPGAHAEFSQAAATVLEDFFRTDVFSFSLSNAAVGITRSFASFSQAAAEANASRIVAGQHFRYDEDAGQTLGAQVANFVTDHSLGNDRHHHRHGGQRFR